MKSKLDYLQYNRRRTSHRGGATRLLPVRSARWLPYLLLVLLCIAALAVLAAVLRSIRAQPTVANLPASATTRQEPATSSQPTAAATHPPSSATAVPPSATATPSVTPIPSAEGVVATFTQTLRLRAAPDTDSEILVELAPGTALVVTGKSADGAWYIVTARERRGWVMAQWVEADAAQVPIVEVQGTLLPTALPTEDHTADYLYMSGITPHVIEIAREGVHAGNRIDVFSKVGDSITANEFFLVPIGQEAYVLGEHGYLQSVIDYYAQATARDGNSFANTSLAAQTGWSAADVLDSANADSDLCEDGESPLECEYRIVRPSIALIMLGTNDIGRPVGEYESAMRQVIEATMDRGIVPLVSTIPQLLVDEAPQREVHVINGVIARLAREYDIPLWDYWAAMNVLPHYGLWEDGAHPNWSDAGDFSPNGLQFGMNVRNLTALQALDAVWRALMLHADSVG